MKPYLVEKGEPAQKTAGGIIHELHETLIGWAASLNELERLMIARGIITKESLERARREYVSEVAE